MVEYYLYAMMSLIVFLYYYWDFPTLLGPIYVEGFEGQLVKRLYVLIRLVYFEIYYAYLYEYEKAFIEPHAYKET